MSCYPNKIVRVTYPKSCCPEVDDSQQLTYSGPALQCIEVQTNQTLNDAIKEIDTFICNTLNSLTTTTTSTSTSTSTTTSTTTQPVPSNICFTHTGEGFPVVSCNVSPEPGLKNGKLYYKAVEDDCNTQYTLLDPYYVWFSTSGTYTNQWVMSPLDNTANANSYLPVSSSPNVPIGTWTLINGSENYVSNSALICPTTTSTSTTTTQL